MKKSAADRKPAPVQDPTAALLEGIKGGVKLKKTTPNVSRAASPQEGVGGLMGALSSKLAAIRRAADGEKDEGDEDGAWN